MDAKPYTHYHKYEFKSNNYTCTDVAGCVVHKHWYICAKMTQEQVR